MGNKPTIKRIPCSILWIGGLFLVLLIAAGGMTLAGRIAYTDRFGCLQRGAYVIDVSRNKDIILAHGPILPDLDLRYPSPNGKTIAHLKYSNVQQAYNFTVSNADGSNERAITMKNAPTAFSGWSADGQYFTLNSPIEDQTLRPEIWSTATLQRVMQPEALWIDWSPSGHRLAYAGKDKLYIVNPDNQVARTYPLSLPESSAFVQWSPDAEYIAVTNHILSSSPAGETIYTVVNLQNGRYSQYSTGNYADSRKALFYSFWIKDSHTFAYLQAHQVDGTTDLMTLDPTTNVLRVMVQDIRDIPIIDSNYIAYTFIENQQWSVEILNVKTGQRTPLIAKAESLLVMPIRSSNNKWITTVGVKSMNDTGNDLIQLLWARSDGSQIHHIDIYMESQKLVALNWVGDQNWLAYATELATGVQLSIVNVETRQQFQIMDGLSRDNFIGDWDVKFSPDGKNAMIALNYIESANPNSNLGYDDLYVVSLGSTSNVKLSRKYVKQPIWSPDSTAVAFVLVNVNNRYAASNLTVVAMDGKVLFDKPNISDDFSISGDFLRWTDCQPIMDN